MLDSIIEIVAVAHEYRRPSYWRDHLPGSPDPALLFVGEGYGALCAQYVALTQSLNAPLITEDRKLRNAVPGIAFSVQEFLV